VPQLVRMFGPHARLQQAPQTVGMVDGGRTRPWQGALWFAGALGRMQRSKTR
jgi:hypothetical protein